MCILGNSRTEESLSGRAAQWALTFSSSEEGEAYYYTRL